MKHRPFDGRHVRLSPGDAKPTALGGARARPTREKGVCLAVEVIEGVNEVGLLVSQCKLGHGHDAVLIARRGDGTRDGPACTLPAVREILHIDMDAFFASVEQRDDPSLQGKPVLVGGPSARGVVAAASYEARKFGVHSAMPMVEAKRRCPNAIVLAPRRERYVELSHAVFAIFRRYTPLVEGLSLDEAFLDVSASRSLFGDGPTIARCIKEQIRKETLLTASAGVAPCKFVAKVASDLRKPDGLVIVPEGQSQTFLDPLPLEKIWGLGQTSSKRLRQAGFRTVGDLARSNPEKLVRLLGDRGKHVWELALGHDDRPVVSEWRAKSIGAEDTFETDLADVHELERCLLSQSGRVARRLLKQGYSAYVVSVKIKLADFTVRTRQTRLAEPVFDTLSIYEAAKELLDRFDLQGAKVRLTGIQMSELTDVPMQPTLFPDANVQRRERLEHVMAQVADRFGGHGLLRADLLTDDAED